METITLNGLIWDTENLEINGKTHFTYEEAKAEAAKRGKRLPTKNDFEELLQLSHIWDTNKKGMWFAEKEADLKNGKSLFLPTAGTRYHGDTVIADAGKFGGYWSVTPCGTINAYYLYFNGTNAYMCNLNRFYGFTVRCVSDINKSEIMKENQEIEFKIPDGYEIDYSKSTKDKIVCKSIEPKYPKSWNEAFISEVIKGYYVEGSSIEKASHNKCTIEDRSTFKTEKQALSSLAYAQLTQLMALPCYNGDWTPNWDSKNQEKYCITRLKSGLEKIDLSGYSSFLAFKSEKVRDKFYHNHMDLIKQFYEL